MRDQIDRFCGAAGQDDLSTAGGVNEVAKLVTSPFVEFRGAVAQCMNTAMDVGMIFALIARDRVDDSRRLLGRSRTVEIDERVAVDVLMKARKVIATVSNICGGF